MFIHVIKYLSLYNNKLYCKYKLHYRNNFINNIYIEYRNITYIYKHKMYKYIFISLYWNKLQYLLANNIY